MTEHGITLHGRSRADVRKLKILILQQFKYAVEEASAIQPNEFMAHSGYASASTIFLQDSYSFDQAQEVAVRMAKFASQNGTKVETCLDLDRAKWKQNFYQRFIIA